MANLKRFETYKVCEISTPTDEFFQLFDSSWTYMDIKRWMFDTYCIDESSVVEIILSTKTVYKVSKDD